MNYEKDIEEYIKIKSYPSGLHLKLNNISRNWQLKLTTLFQMLGCNKKLANRNRSKELVMNIGCQNIFFDKAINTDLIPTFGQIFRGDWKLEKDIAYVNLCYSDKHLYSLADGIVLSHVLEHIPVPLIERVLKNARKFLKNEGKIRIVVPSIYSYMNADIPKNQKFEDRTISINSLIYRWGHQVMYDYNMVEYFLKKAGFDGITKQSYKSGCLAEFDSENRIGESLYVTAKK